MPDTRQNDFSSQVLIRSEVQFLVARFKFTNAGMLDARFPLLLSGLTITFVKELGLGVWITLPLLLSLGLAITILGQIAGRTEGWAPFDSFYWSFITATTVGYGDIRPTRVGSRIIAIFIGILGLTFTGIIIAIAVHAGTVALAAHDAAGKMSSP